jgi:hypothetical protein
MRSGGFRSAKKTARLVTARRYRIVEVALGGSGLVSRDTLVDESSGYWLVPSTSGADG